VVKPDESSQTLLPLGVIRVAEPDARQDLFRDTRAADKIAERRLDGSLRREDRIVEDLRSLRLRRPAQVWR
jgi:hypothetical protein